MSGELSYSKQRTVFSLNAPIDADKVLVRIYSSAHASLPEQTLPLAWVGTDCWVGSVQGDLLGKFYTFEVYPCGSQGEGLGECPGTFAKAVSVNGQRAAIIDMASTNPDGWQQDKRPAISSPSDLVIYELHHRDFSIHPDSGYIHKGKYLALTEPKALFYLNTLGVNAVQLQPSFDFATVDESHPEWAQYNWGYDPQNYNVPEGSYATNAHQPEVRIREFKQMVLALHKAGIRVILDVVYNHCYSIDESNFQRTYPNYYFRTVNDNGQRTNEESSNCKWSNGSGCGNETASERLLMRQFMIESVRYWATEYHIDGFRFDLMGIHDAETMKQIRKTLDQIDPSITLHGEPWSADSCALDYSLLANKEAITTMPGIGAFGNEMRDAILNTWLTGKAEDVESIKLGIVGGIEHPEVDMQKASYLHRAWAQQPTQHTSYVTCHDDLCLADRLRTSFPNIQQQALLRLDMLAQTPVLLSQGVPFLYAGEEVLRSKQGISNAYNSPDEINRIDWNGLMRHPELFLYYRGLIQLRREHPAFRMGYATQVRRHLHFLPATGCVIAFWIDGTAVGDSWSTIYVVLNPNKRTRKISVPTGYYTVVCKNGRINLDGLSSHRGGNVCIGGQQALIFHSTEEKVQKKQQPC